MTGELSKNVQCSGFVTLRLKDVSYRPRRKCHKSISQIYVSGSCSVTKHARTHGLPGPWQNSWESIGVSGGLDHLLMFRSRQRESDLIKCRIPALSITYLDFSITSATSLSSLAYCGCEEAIAASQWELM